MTTTKKYSLPRDFAEKWVKALRSGEYKQGKERLGSADDGYCCLGVAGVVCDVPDEAMKDKSVFASNYRVTNSIPKELRGGYLENNLVNELVEKNDYGGLSFPEIADWIEANVEFV